MSQAENNINESIINDVSAINPIVVAKIVTPTTIEEIQKMIKQWQGAIAIGGGRFSMGGHTAIDHGLHIDMRKFNKILTFNAAEKTICVQAGIRWSDIQKYIDVYDLSIKIMQTYANFTVGGALSVNAHGRYIGQGALIHSVKSLKVILANGEVTDASTDINKEIFFGVIGGYGGIGVIVEATLILDDNTKLERQQVKFNTADYYNYFIENIKTNHETIFHNGDIYPPHYQKVRAISWAITEKPVNVPYRLTRPKNSYLLERYFIWAISTTPLGKWRREFIIDPVLYLFKRIAWRNYEAGSYDVAELEPKSREKYTYILQEYFIPITRYNEFLPKMIEILRRYNVNILNISIRHANKDPDSLLSWAREEVFAFVLYYKQNTSDKAKNKVAIWTRELIDAAISVSGAYYLPYQLHATPEQFHQAYPRAKEFFNLKGQLDPGNKFSNKLWEKYYYGKGENINMKISNTSSNFHEIFSTIEWKDKFYTFLQNIYNIYPENTFHMLIQDCCQQYDNDQDIYQAIQQNLPSIKPFLAPLRYALPALSKQKKVITQQTLRFLGNQGVINGYIEIGSTGRYVSELRKHCEIHSPIYLINDEAPSFSPVDIMERGQLPKLGTFIPLNNYEAISSQNIADASVDLVTCYIGLHHAPLNKLHEFVMSIHRVLRPGGKFIVRDHDVNSNEMRSFVSLIHTVFNAGLDVSWEKNNKELRNFVSVKELIAYLESHGFKASPTKILQQHDPSLNLLMEFTKNNY